MRNSILIIILILITSNFLLAVGESTVVFVGIQPSANSNGMAGAYTGLPTNDTYCAFYNPAQIGYFAKTENFSIQSVSVDWLPGFKYSNLEYKHFGLTTGYNLQKLWSNIPVSIGLGYMRGYLDLGKTYWTDELGEMLFTYNSNEEYNAISIGANFSWYFDAAFGITHKFINSNLSPEALEGEQIGLGSAEGNATDIGLLLSFPIDQLCSGMFDFIPSKNFKLFPLIKLSTGLAVMNIGDEIRYSHASNSDALPRDAKLGIGIQTGLGMTLNGININLLNVEYSSEAIDRLINKDTTGTIEYQAFPGDIDIYDNIILNKNSSKIINRHGYSIEIAEILKYSYGNFNGSGFSKINTFGYSISSRGILKLIAARKSPTYVNEILAHFDLRFNYAIYSPNESWHPLENTTFMSVSLNIFGF